MGLSYESQEEAVLLHLSGLLHSAWAPFFKEQVKIPGRVPRRNDKDGRRAGKCDLREKLKRTFAVFVASLCTLSNSLMSYC